MNRIIEISIKNKLIICLLTMSLIITGIYSVKKLPTLAFDHKKILEYGVDRLKAKIGYSNIVMGLLPDEFTLTDLQKKHEVILGHSLYKRNLKKGYLYSAIYHRFANATITRIASTVPNSNLIYAIFQKVNKSSNTGVEMVISQNIKK